jgi:hypothetical protein
MNVPTGHIDVYKEHVKRAVLDWPRGCYDGKVEFLKRIGVNVEEDFEGTITVTLEFPVSFSYDPEDISLQRVADEIGSYIENSIGSYVYVDDGLEVDISYPNVSTDYYE